jgi:hypothetical protein
VNDILCYLLNLILSPELYDNPDVFNPERYLLTENGTKPGVDGSDLRPNLAFGCGRVNIVDYAFAIMDPDNFVTAANLPRIPPCTELDCMLSFFHSLGNSHLYTLVGRTSIL